MLLNAGSTVHCIHHSLLMYRQATVADSSLITHRGTVILLTPLTQTPTALAAPSWGGPSTLLIGVPLTLGPRAWL